MTIIIIQNPPKPRMQALQDVLVTELEGTIENKKKLGISDIWVSISPFYLAAENNGSIVGVASISWGCQAAEIHKIYVAPTHRKKGVAKILFDVALRLFRQNDIEEVIVEIASDAGGLFLQSATAGLCVKHWFDNKYIIYLNRDPDDCEAKQDSSGG